MPYRTLQLTLLRLSAQPIISWAVSDELLQGACLGESRPCQVCADRFLISRLIVGYTGLCACDFQGPAAPQGLETRLPWGGCPSPCAGKGRCAPATVGQQTPPATICCQWWSHHTSPVPSEAVPRLWRERLPSCCLSGLGLEREHHEVAAGSHPHYRRCGWWSHGLAGCEFPRCWRETRKPYNSCSKERSGPT